MLSEASIRRRSLRSSARAPDLSFDVQPLGTAPKIAISRRAPRCRALLAASITNISTQLKDLPAELPHGLVTRTERREEASCSSDHGSSRSGERLCSRHGATRLRRHARQRILWLRDHAPPPLRGALCELYTYKRYKRMPASWLGRQLASGRITADRLRRRRSWMRIPLRGWWLQEPRALPEKHIAPSSGFLHDEPVLAERAPRSRCLPDPLSRSSRSLARPVHIRSREQKRLCVPPLPDHARGDAEESQDIQRFMHDGELADAFDRIAPRTRPRTSIADRKIWTAITCGHSPRRRRRRDSRKRMHTLWD